MGYAEKVASLTTLSTLHNGSLTIDRIMRLPKPVIRVGSKFADSWFRLLGDKSPSTYRAICSFQTSKAEKFNDKNSDDPRVYYQSHSFIMKKASSDFFMSVPYLVVKHYEEANDGLLLPKSTQWSNYKGVYQGSGKRGISHMDEVDFRRKKISGNSRGNRKNDDIIEVYLDILRELKQRDF